MFGQKYPASAAFVLLIANILKDAASALQPGQSALQKIMGFENLAPALIGFLPQIGALAGEVKQYSVGDDIAAAEMLVSDLAFSSDKAQKIVAALFPVMEELAALEPKVEALVAAIQA